MSDEEYRRIIFALVEADLKNINNELQQLQPIFDCAERKVKEQRTKKLRKTEI